MKVFKEIIHHYATKSIGFVLLFQPGKCFIGLSNPGINVSNFYWPPFAPALAQFGKCFFVLREPSKVMQSQRRSLYPPFFVIVAKSGRWEISTTSLYLLKTAFQAS